MAHITTNHAVASTGFFSGIGAFFSRFSRVMDEAVQSSRRMREIERLSAKSDAELAELGLKRDGIVQHVFRDLYYI